jgi:hypothetical protein
MWAGLRGTFRVAKSLELREALRAGLGVRFQSLPKSWPEIVDPKPRALG